MLHSQELYEMYKREVIPSNQTYSSIIKSGFTLITNACNRTGLKKKIESINNYFTRVLGCKDELRVTKFTPLKIKKL